MYGVDYNNPWITDALSAPRRASALLCALVAAALGALVLFSARAFAQPFEIFITGALQNLPPPWSVTSSQAIVQIMVFGLLLAIGYAATRTEGRTLWRPESRPLLSLICGLIIGGAGLSLSVGMAWSMGTIKEAVIAPVSAPIGGVAMGAFLVAFQSASEEVYFRGWLQPVLCARWGPWVGLIASSALFAGLHIIGGAQSFVALLNIFLGGVMFGLLALRSGGLFAAVGAHFAWNWTEAGCFGLAPITGGAIATLQLRPETQWGGSSGNMNDSTATTIVLLVIVVGLVLLGSTRSAPRAKHQSDHAL